jgi:lysophospholipase L1-like esterase
MNISFCEQKLRGPLLCLLLCLSGFVFAQDKEQDLLADRNGDGVLALACFGDSITYGVGDGTEPGEFVEIAPETDGAQGYHRRVEVLGGFPARNYGQPGEYFLVGGLQRLPELISLNNSDLIAIFEGANDAIEQVSSAAFERGLQQAINISRADGLMPIVFTIPASCCNREGREIFTREYSRIVRARASLNQVPLVDIERAWDTTCQNKTKCELFNIPDGIHPNTRGYDVIAQTVMAALYGIDLFAAGGAAQLESALGLPAGSVIVKPDPTVTEGQ